MSGYKSTDSGTLQSERYVLITIKLPVDIQLINRNDGFGASLNELYMDWKQVLNTEVHSPQLLAMALHIPSVRVLSWTGVGDCGVAEGM